jgi:hypothetical protein
MAVDRASAFFLDRLGIRVISGLGSPQLIELGLELSNPCELNAEVALSDLKLLGEPFDHVDRRIAAWGPCWALPTR